MVQRVLKHDLIWSDVARGIRRTFYNVLVTTLSGGEGKLSNYDKEVLKRIEDIEQLDGDTRNKLFFLIDNVVQNFKTKQAFAK